MISLILGEIMEYMYMKSIFKDWLGGEMGV